MALQENTGKEQKIQQVADQILRLSHDSLLVHMRFLDVALAKLSVTCRAGMGAHVFDGEGLVCDPLLLIRQYEQEKAMPVRLYLHALLHAVFRNTGIWPRISLWRRWFWIWACI